MSEFDRVMERLDAVENSMQRMFRWGNVTSVDEITGWLRVQFEDLDEQESATVPFFTPNSKNRKVWNPPESGDQVVCIFPPSTQERGGGFALPSWFYEGMKPPSEATPTNTVTKYSDGATYQYDPVEKQLTIRLPGDKDFTIDGNVIENIKGDFTKTIDGSASITGKSGIDMDAGNGGATAKIGTNGYVSLSNKSEGDASDYAVLFNKLDTWWTNVMEQIGTRIIAVFNNHSHPAPGSPPSSQITQGPDEPLDDTKSKTVKLN